ncbi:MAG: acyltransferase, partial [Rhizobacter sp.]
MSLNAPNAAATGRKLNHLPALDGLRGLAILLVLAHNFATVELPQGLVGHVIDLALDGGWIGVQLFFVLSGFLITRILLQTQDAPNYYRAFFGRRVLRIFPLYYAALFVGFVVFPLLGRVGPALAHDQGQQLWLWLYVSNWTHLLNFESQLFPHFWSLAIEEQFYLLWPLLVHRRSALQVLRLCLVVAVVSLLMRVAMLWQGADSGTVYTYTVCRMDALALGAAVAAWLQMPGVAVRLGAQRQRLAWGVGLLWVVGLVATHGYPRTSPLG